MNLINFGVMRSGIHTFLIWVIHQFNTSVLYNNINNINDIDNRVISPNDTRLDVLTAKKIVLPSNPHKLTIYSFESQYLNDALYDSISKVVSPTTFTMVVRNPYNNLASLLAYYESGGSSQVITDMICNETFEEYWIQMVQFAVKHNFIIVLYDEFINSELYRKELTKKIGIPLITNQLTHPLFGGGSSFKDSKNYKERYIGYLKHPYMVKVLNNKTISSLWEQIQKTI